LHAPNDALRDDLVPLNRKYPLHELLDACRRYLKHAPRDFITFEYCMLDGVNDRPEQAHELLKLIHGKDQGGGIHCKFNLIPFNPFLNRVWSAQVLQRSVHLRGYSTMRAWSQPFARRAVKTSMQPAVNWLVTFAIVPVPTNVWLGAEPSCCRQPDRHRLQGEKAEMMNARARQGHLIRTDWRNLGSLAVVMGRHVRLRVSDPGTPSTSDEQLRPQPVQRRPRHLRRPSRG
jgi:hypothetical protein